MSIFSLIVGDSGIRSIRTSFYLLKEVNYILNTKLNTRCICVCQNSEKLIKILSALKGKSKPVPRMCMPTTFPVDLDEMK